MQQLAQMRRCDSIKKPKNEHFVIMSTKTFKTNIHCSGCLAKATPFLDRTAGEDNWDLDLQNPDKILTVISEDADPDKIELAVKEAGYVAELAN
jgi:copper chaperone